MNKNKCYITTPIYYVNSKPHLGTLYSTLLADVTARWHKLLGQKVFFLTGTDEHGQKIQEKATQLNMKPQAFVDSMVPEFKQVWKRFNIDYDKFIRTTDQEHVKSVTYFINKLKEQDDVYKSEYTGWYCVPDETFVTIDNESVKSAHGYLCPTCKRELREVAEESYFFRLSAYEERLLKFYEQHPDFITPKDRLNEVISFVKSGLKDLSISRKTVSWGIPFPGDPGHTVYVWGDALTNYISAIGYGQQTPEAQASFDFWWPADLHIMAKDIVRFHAVYWPAFLMAAGLPLPKKLMVHGYILFDNQKMSKSLGNVMDPDQLADWYGIDQVRYYLLRQISINQDGHFDLKTLEEHINADLANNLGNLLSRTVALAVANQLSTINAPEAWEVASAALREKCEEAFRLYWEEMNKGFYHVALADLFKFISEVNAYFHAQQPWILAKQNKELFAEVISASCHSLHAIAIMLWPIMPEKMEQLLKTLGSNFDLKKNYEEELRKNIWNKKFMVTKNNEPLFARPEIHSAAAEEKPQEELKKTEEQSQEQSNKSPLISPLISIDEFVKADLRVGTIETCVSLAGSDKLYKMTVNLGPLGTRQILAGIAKSFTPEQLIGKQALFIVNLAPRKMMGETSQGMMLVAKNEAGVIQLTAVGAPCENGARLC